MPSKTEGTKKKIKREKAGKLSGFLKAGAFEQGEKAIKTGGFWWPGSPSLPLPLPWLGVLTPAVVAVFFRIPCKANDGIGKLGPCSGMSLARKNLYISHTYVRGERGFPKWLSGNARINPDLCDVDSLPLRRLFKTPKSEQRGDCKAGLPGEG